MSEVIVRRAQFSDLEALVDLEHRAMHFPMGHRVREWFRDDFPGDYRNRFAVAEHDGRLVSAALLVPMPISYRGVLLEGAYWEAVVTDDGFRRQGLCRKLFDFLTPNAGVDAIFVWGATWLYRRFGYFPALRNYGTLDSVQRIVQAAELPASTLTFRPAETADVPYLSGLRRQSDQRYVVSVPVTEEKWRHELRPDRTVAGPGETGLNRWCEIGIVLSGERPVGYFIHDPWDLACLMELEVDPNQTTWREAGAVAIRATAAFAKSETVSSSLPDSHPIYAAYPRAFRIATRPFGDNAASISDSVKFLMKIRSVLEQSLQNSPLAGWSGEITLSRIRDGLRMAFERGKIVECSALPDLFPAEARVRLTAGRFEALVFGYRSLIQILDEDPDCSADEEAQAVLQSMFMVGDSFVRPI